MPNITWTKDDKEIVRNMGKVVFKKWAIILEDLTTQDKGDYTCKLCNKHGCINHKFRLEVTGENLFSSILRTFLKKQILEKIELNFSFKNDRLPNNKLHKK